MSARCWLCLEPIVDGPRVNTAFGWLVDPDGFAHQEPAHVGCHWDWRYLDGPWWISDGHVVRLG